MPPLNLGELVCIYYKIYMELLIICLLPTFTGGIFTLRQGIQKERIIIDTPNRPWDINWFRYRVR